MGRTLRVPHCSHWGAYTLLVEDGRITGVEPFPDDPDPSPLIHSVKSWAEPELRILRPMVRKSWLENRERSDGRLRGKEGFVPVSWDVASHLVADEIKRVRQQHGAASIFAGSYGWTSAGRFHHAATLLKRMLGLHGGYTNHVDTYSIAAGPVILRHTLGSDEACYGRASTLDTVAAATETLVIFGALSPRTAQSEAGGIARHTLNASLRSFAKRGIRIVLVSPLRDDVPDWLDVDWWPVRPNTDTALMLGLAGEIVAAGLHDMEFLRRCCSGWERLLAYLRGETDGVRKNAAWAAGITGLDAAAIRSLAPTLVNTRTMLTVSWSLQRAQHGEQPFWAALALAALSGQIGLPGGGVGYGYGSTAGLGGPIGIGKSPAMSALKNPTGSFIPVSRIAEMLLNPGEPFDYEGVTRNFPDIRMVYWAGGNPFHHHQDINRLIEAWARPETIVVQEPMWTPTALHADIVLPACTSIERNDIAGNLRTEQILAMHQAIAPLGESRSDFDIFNHLAHLLGVAEPFNEGRDEMGWIRHLYEMSRAGAGNLGFALPHFEAFWERGAAEVPMKQGFTYLADFRADPESHPLRTESGRIVLGSETLARLSYADCGAHPAWLEPLEWLGSAQRRDQLHLISHQPKGRLHSQLPAGEASMAQKRDGREFARLSPVDAARLGIAAGATVRLWNSRGQCLAVASVDPAVSEGVVVLPTGGWFTPYGKDGLDISGNPNVLTPDIPTSRFGQGCAAYTCLVSVEPFREEIQIPDAMSYYQYRIGQRCGR